MQLRDLVMLRRDLMFHGAVQIGWFETDPEKTRKAAENFVFHGPKYHGVKEKDFRLDSAYRLRDTVSFTLEVLKQLGANGSEAAPIMLAAAGYGTGKSHLGLTLAVLLSDGLQSTRQKILENLKAADEELGAQIEFLLKQWQRPYLVVPINGMQDFDLAEEIRRQILSQLKKKNIPTRVLEELRPRFLTSKQFTISFFDTHRSDFQRHFGEKCRKEDILELLDAQDEDAFRRVNAVYEGLLHQSIVAAGRESLQDFLGTFAKEYCGPEKAFQGLVIIFDEFGRYLEFAVQRPHIAGPQGLQQLFEGVQDNAQSIFLLGFIQSELKAYVSRVPAELRDQLERFVTRYEAVPKARLSTNLETIIANLLYKKDLNKIAQIMKYRQSSESPSVLIQKLCRWFPEMGRHGLWRDPVRFAQVVQEGCWPLHPMTTWLLYFLSAVGKSLQQRSALSFLDDVMRAYEAKPLDGAYWSIPPVALCSDGMIAEFKTSEEYGDSLAIAHAFDEAVSRFKNELTESQEKILKAVVIAGKTGLTAVSEADFIEAAAVLAGMEVLEASRAFEDLTKEYRILEWDEALRRYVIVGDAVPRRVFLRFLAERVRRVESEHRASLFRAHLASWVGIDQIPTDYGAKKKVSTQEWNFAVTFTTVASLRQDIERALKEWADSYGVDECRGRVLYCYVGPDSHIREVRDTVRRILDDTLRSVQNISHLGAPIAVVLVHDMDGSLGQDLAEYWILEEESNQESFARFRPFLGDHKQGRKEWITQRVGSFLESIQGEDFISACACAVPGGRTKDVFHKIFDCVYPDLVPFPFDGFHTARGNAAKDCIQFTRDLFLGNLNHTAIASYAPQQKNRAVKVLDQTWGIFLPDGSVSKKPRHHRIALLIDWLNNALVTEGSVNLGQAIRTFCRPPFGCNVASAGLLLGVFIAPRRDDMQIRYRGEIKSIEEWLGIAIERNFFRLDILNHTEIERISIGQRDFWNDFLDNWEKETTFEGRAALCKKAVLIEKERPVPPGLRYRFEFLKREAQDALKALESYYKILEKQRGYASQAFSQADSGSLARSACSLQNFLHRMREQGPAWTQEQLQEMENEYLSCRVAAVQFFEDWLALQTVEDPKQYGDFQLRLTKTAENFERLGLPKLAQNVRAQLEKATAELERLQRLKTIFEEVDTFLKATMITPTSKVLEIRNSLNRISELEKKVQEAFQARLPALRLNELWERLQQLKKSAEVQLRGHKKRAEAVWNRNLDSIDDVLDTAQEVRTLMTLFDGLEEDLADFRLMRRVLSLIEEHYRHMNSLHISESELDHAYAKALSDLQGLLGEDDEIPWSIEETLGKLKQKIEESRRQMGEEWVARHVPKPNLIPTMQAKDILETRRHLETAPRYLTPKQEEKVRLALEACSKRLQDLEVEGLIARFEELSPEAQKEFLRRILLLTDRSGFKATRGG